MSPSFRASLTILQFELINAYVVDPAHIAPSRTDANSNGHFPTGQGQAPTGTPRGFNLQNFAMNSMLPMGFNAMPNFSQMFAAGAMQNPASWAPPAAGEERAGGPIRRGGGFGAAGGRGYNQRSGPYDRPRNPRWGQDGSAMGGNMMGGGGRQPRGGRWGDGAGGGAAVGPREAIQGRTIKSYEDLDQASGSGGGGELNY